MAINKATEALIPRLVGMIEAQRRDIDTKISQYVIRGEIDYAENCHGNFRNGQPNGYIRRPRKIRVATMEAAIDYLNTHKPTGVKEVIKRTTYQTNGAPDCYLQVTFSDIPDFSVYVGPEAAIMFAERAMQARDEAHNARVAMLDSYYSMQEVVLASWKDVTNVTINMKQSNDDRERRLRIVSLNGQMRRDVDHTGLNTPEDEVRYLSQTVSSLYSFIPDPDTKRKVGDAYEAVNTFIQKRRAVESAHERANEMMDKADEFEQKVRSNTLVAA